jgi:predicted DNA-binding transcriptional regulator YafY
MNQTFTDNCGDEIDVIRSNGYVYLCVQEDDSEATVELSENTAAKIAEALLGDNAQKQPESAADYNESLLRLAVAHNETVAFTYAKGNGGVIEQRRLNPESVFTNKRGDLLVGGQDPDRDDYRAYRVDRIKGRIYAG